MGFFKDLVGTVKNYVDGSDDQSIGDTLQRFYDPIGNYAIKKAYANDTYEPGAADRETAEERAAAQSRAATWKNPLVKTAKYTGDARTAQGAASQRQAQNRQLNRVQSTAPTYWQNLVGQAARYTGQGKEMQSGSDSYGNTYIKQQIAGNLSSWGNINYNPQTNTGGGYAGNASAGYGEGDNYASAYGNEGNTNQGRWYQYDTSKGPQYYDTSYTSPAYE